MDITQQISKQGIVQLEKMAQAGSKNASASLSRLIDQEMKVVSLAVRTLPVEKITEIIGSPEDMVTTIIMEIKGDVFGRLALIYPQKASFNVADLLAKRENGVTTRLSELDKSALKETGNIIAGAFLSAISDYLAVNMVESIPDIATDMLKSTIDFMLAGFAKKGTSEAVAFEIDFEMGTAEEAEGRVGAYFVLLLDVESVTKILEALRGISGGEDMTEKKGTK